MAPWRGAHRRQEHGLDAGGLAAADGGRRAQRGAIDEVGHKQGDECVQGEGAHDCGGGWGGRGWVGCMGRGWVGGARLGWVGRGRVGWGWGGKRVRPPLPRPARTVGRGRPRLAAPAGPNSLSQPAPRARRPSAPPPPTPRSPRISPQRKPASTSTQTSGILTVSASIWPILLRDGALRAASALPACTCAAHARARRFGGFIMARVYGLNKLNPTPLCCYDGERAGGGGL
jgi:hypothetical protein